MARTSKEEKVMGNERFYIQHAVVKKADGTVSVGKCYAYKECAAAENKKEGSPGKSWVRDKKTA